MAKVRDFATSLGIFLTLIALAAIFVGSIFALAMNPTALTIVVMAIFVAGFYWMLYAFLNLVISEGKSAKDTEERVIDESYEETEC